MATRAAEWERSLREADNGSEPLRDVFIRLFLEADARLAGVEGTASSVAALQVLMTQDANTLINAVVTPLLAQIRAAADMGVLFSATSVSETAIGTGVKTFTIPVGMRTAFAPAAQLAIVAADDPAKAMWARKLGYNSETGVLTVDVYSTQGTGTVSSWSITAGIAASMAAHVAVAATGMVPVGNLQGALAALSAALGDDPDFADTVADALASRYTKSEADTLLAAKQTKTDASTALAGVAPTGNTFPYFTDATTAALVALSEYVRGSGFLAAGDQPAARAVLGAAASHNARITGNLRFAVRTPIDAIFDVAFTPRRVFVYDTRLDTDSGAWRSRMQDDRLFNRTGASRKDFPAIAIFVAQAVGRNLRTFDAEQLSDSGVPPLWASNSFNIGTGDTCNGIAALNAFVCLASAGGLVVSDILGDRTLVYKVDRATVNDGLGNTAHGSGAFPDDMLVNIGSTNAKAVHMIAMPGQQPRADGIVVPTILVATDAGFCVIKPDGSVVKVTRSGGYIDACFDGPERIRLVDASGNVEVGPVPTADVANTVWRHHVFTAEYGAVRAVSREAEATPRGVLYRNLNTDNFATSMIALTGADFATMWMPANVRRSYMCDVATASLVAAAPLSDDCSSTTGWTLGTGWTHDATEFDHAPGNTAPNDRALSGLTVGVRYRVRFLVANRSAGSLAVSLLTASGETGALSVAANGEHVVGFTATATTDTLRFVPTSDFNGSVQNVVVEASFGDYGPAGRDLKVSGTLTRLLSGGVIRYVQGWSASNFLSDEYTTDLDFAGDFSVLAVINAVSSGTRTYIQRASAPSSGARWELRAVEGVMVFEISDGTTTKSVSVAHNASRPRQVVGVRRGGTLEIWIDGELGDTEDVSDIGSLSNASATLRFGARVDGSNLLAGNNRFKHVVIAASAPSPAQIARAWVDIKKTLFGNAVQCLGGASSDVKDVQYDEISRQVVVAADGVSVLKGFVQSARHDTLTSALGSNAVTDVAIRGATIAAVSPSGAHAYRAELAAVMNEGFDFAAAPAVHGHALATTSLPGFLSAADKAKLDGLNKTHVGLANVDNTADLAKPVSTAQAAAIAAAVKVKPNVPRRNYVAGATWLSSTSAADNNWQALCWAGELGLFVAVGNSGTGNRVMTSPDGITWTVRTPATDNDWFGVCWSPELGLLIAVANSGTGNRVMTSPDGITWTSRTSPSDNNWRSPVWAKEISLVVSIANSGSGRVMTSPDGLAWTARTPATTNNWAGLCWSPELRLFVAVATSGTGNRVMTSPDGINWTSRVSAADNSWVGVCWSSELMLFVAVALSGTGNRVMTSPDGITWTLRTSAADNDWRAVVWSRELGLFVAVAETGTGNRVMTSPNGIDWTIRTSAANNDWRGLTWSPELGLFAATAVTGVGNRVMTSVSAFKYPYRS